MLASGVDVAGSRGAAAGGPTFAESPGEKHGGGGSLATFAKSPGEKHGAGGGSLVTWKLGAFNCGGATIGAATQGIWNGAKGGNATGDTGATRATGAAKGTCPGGRDLVAKG